MCFQTSLVFKAHCSRESIQRTPLQFLPAPSFAGPVLALCCHLLMFVCMSRLFSCRRQFFKCYFFQSQHYKKQQCFISWVFLTWGRWHPCSMDRLIIDSVANTLHMYICTLLASHVHRDATKMLQL